MARHLYVETSIRADLDALWLHTQDPALHQRWDLRFGRIRYLPRAEGEPQRFRYSTLGVSGVGVSAGERHRPDGTRTSALRFGSRHPLSPIRSGSGYWRYVPVRGGLRFLTAYGYRPHVLPGWLMWWATAWSFDRLRLWLETGRTPERSLLQALAELAARALAAVVAWTPVVPGPVAVAVTVLAIVLPPLPGTPAARRCLRRPPTQEEPCPRSSSSRSATPSTACTPSSSGASASGSTPARRASDAG
ncbi:hypothetical protein ABT294_07965 [Nonomuraea sp. NPDC000554]|uniref:hypothetical protein n=1 Tax=Nonomuraea sp. NPDC000554 TaxID=3154259 RepID=UPI00331960F4